MCKIIALFFSVCLASHSLCAQDEPVNDPDKFLFYEVVEADSTSAGLLYHNALAWIKKNATSLSVTDSTKGILHGEDEITVYKEVGVLKKISGKVSYKTEVEIKENLYRYHFYDFVFHYYGPDRFYKVGPTGKKKRLDETQGAGWQKLWDLHRADTRAHIELNIKTLKIKIIERPVVKSIEPKKEIKWK